MGLASTKAWPRYDITQTSSTHTGHMHRIHVQRSKIQTPWVDVDILRIILRETKELFLNVDWRNRSWKIKDVFESWISFLMTGSVDHEQDSPQVLLPWVSWSGTSQTGSCFSNLASKVSNTVLILSRVYLDYQEYRLLSLKVSYGHQKKRIVIYSYSMELAHANTYLDELSL